MLRKAPASKMVESSIIGNAPWLWSCVYGLGLALLAVAAAHSMRKSGGGALLPWLLAVALAAAAAHAADRIEWLAPRLSEDLLATLRTTTLIAGGSLATWLVSTALLRRPADRSLRPAVWLVINGAWLLALSSEKLAELIAPRAHQAAGADLPEIHESDLVEARDARFQTDRGHTIGAFRLNLSWQEAQLSSAKQPYRNVGLPERTISRAPPDPASNCHGWVFTGGRFVIKGTEVDGILGDNDYRRVDQPRAGDVVVYRSTADGRVLHTGVVKAAEDDLVLIESKWGAWGRYVHQPEHQPYSEMFSYYRSPRRGHQLLPRIDASPVARQRSRRQADRKKRIQLSCIMPATSASA